jgi:hypothetical protein
MNLLMLKQEQLHCKFAVVIKNGNDLYFVLCLCTVNKLKF